MATEDVLEWPKIRPIDNALPPVEAFSLHLLPKSLRPLVEDVAYRMQVPFDFPAIVAMLTLAGTVNRRAVVQPKVHDTAWTEVPNLWGGLVAPPGYKKSPVIQAVIAPLERLQSEWWRADTASLGDHSQAIEEHELRVSAWKELYKKASKKKDGAPPPERPGPPPKPPTIRRLIVNDATVEALHQKMSENPPGVLVIQDELTGWLAQMEKPGRESERAFCLSAWNGNTSHTLDRIGRGTVRVEACCMSLLGGIQPARLRSYLAQALSDGPGNDGLIQRLQLLVWPDLPPNTDYIDQSPNLVAMDEAEESLRRLADLDAMNPVRLVFEPGDAQDLFVDWYSVLDQRVVKSDMHPAMASHLGKYRGLMPSLAALLQLSEATPQSGDLLTISLENTKRAAAWCVYLESHADRIYSCAVNPLRVAVQALADKIRKGKLGGGGPFTARDIYLQGWSGLTVVDVVKGALEVLEDYGWIRALARGGPTGRPSVPYEVNPALGDL